MSDSLKIQSLAGTLGVAEIGAIVSTFLFGIETLQAYYYFTRYPQDSVFLKSMVAAVWFIELGHTTSISHAIYMVTVTFYGQPQHLETPPYSIETTIFFAALIYGVVQSFFANRVRLFSGRWMIPLICWIMTALRVIANLAMMGIQWVNPDITTIQVKFRWLMGIALSLGVTVDITTTFSMCYWLWKARPTGFEHTKRMIDTLLVWTVETGVATTVTSILFLVTFLSLDNLVWFPFFLIQVKLYSNSLFVSLNGRQRLRLSGQLLNISIGAATIPIPEGNRVGLPYSAMFVLPLTGPKDLVFEMSKGVETDFEHGRLTD
ncbi:Saposin B-type domain-containing protein [Mycena sanguinolenta]|uniref:Saposin B-type domain-containing protein n=1 Tax=Mycena sanguinolenta TaxID=230812 RepID=A0A8H7CL39_9AGAR|nr:Saposin B-type domain-containing protein [Mycena sanguinolenta]